ncbi:MAG TPA: hypothetical protein VGK02_02300 [Candidatus Aquicultor sp.]|jgi:hypothetical protein
MMTVLFYLWVILHAVTAAIISIVLLKPLKEMLRGAGAVKTNFRGVEVVNMLGLLIIVSWLFLMVIAVFASLLASQFGIVVPDGFIIGPEFAVMTSLLIIGAGFFGLIDDAFGNRESSGFKGHIGALVKGKLTTGGLKAIGIPATAVVVSSLLSGGIVNILGNAILISLFVNALNLLDLRPGRALKAYIPLQLLILFVGGSSLGTISAAMIGVALVLIAADLREEIMLGDTGSNILGAMIGFCAAAAFDWNVKLPLIVVLVLLQLLTEKYSISAIVERVGFLRALDNIGRRVE